VGDASPDARADASIPAPRDAGCPDSDSDGVCDGRDTCPGYDDTADRDGDGVPDDCDDYPDGGSANDLDGDGVANEFDICPAGPDADNNGDGIPDGCGQVLAIVTWEGQEPVGTNYLFAVEMPGKIVIYDPTGLRAPGSEPGIKTWLRDTNSSTAEGASRLDNWSGDLHAALAVSSNPRDLSPPASWTAATVTGFRVDLIQTSPTLRFQWQVLGYR